jgi:hypothetical protein
MCSCRVVMPAHLMVEVEAEVIKTVNSVTGLGVAEGYYGMVWCDTTQWTRCTSPH